MEKLKLLTDSRFIVDFTSRFLITIISVLRLFPWHFVSVRTHSFNGDQWKWKRKKKELSGHYRKGLKGTCNIKHKTWALLITGNGSSNLRKARKSFWTSRWAVFVMNWSNSRDSKYHNFTLKHDKSVDWQVGNFLKWPAASNNINITSPLPFDVLHNFILPS